MKYYFKGEEDEFAATLVDVFETSDNSRKFIWKKDEQIFELVLKKISEFFFYKIEGQKDWKKIPNCDQLDSVFFNQKILKLFVGFKLTTSNQANIGSAVTKMPGKVVKIFVKEGDYVKKGDKILVLEAMKMENIIKAGMNGIVKKILVFEGDALEEGVLMVDIKVEDSSKL